MFGITGLFLYLLNARSIITAYFHILNGDCKSSTVGSDGERAEIVSYEATHSYVLMCKGQFGQQLRTL